MLTDTTGSPYAKVHALDGMKVKWTGGLWKERFDTCANSTVPQLKHMFDSKDISHVVENFKICFNGHVAHQRHHHIGKSAVPQYSI